MPNTASEVDIHTQAILRIELYCFLKIKEKIPLTNPQNKGASIHNGVVIVKPYCETNCVTNPTTIPVSEPTSGPKSIPEINIGKP